MVTFHNKFSFASFYSVSSQAQGAQRLSLVNPKLTPDPDSSHSRPRVTLSRRMVTFHNKISFASFYSVSSKAQGAQCLGLVNPRVNPKLTPELSERLLATH
jgi:hypothetical protein